MILASPWLPAEQPIIGLVTGRVLNEAQSRTFKNNPTKHLQMFSETTETAA